MTKLGKFCLYTPIKILLISTLLSIILPWALVPPSSPPPHSNDTRGIILGIAIYLNIFVSILSYTVYFNFYKSVRNNIFLSFLTFSVFSILLFIITLICLPSEIVTFALIVLPSLIPQTYYFIRFRKRLKSGEIIDDFYKEGARDYD